MSEKFINENTIYSSEDFPTREELLNIKDEIKVKYYLQYIKKNILLSIINNQSYYTLNITTNMELKIEPWILSKVIKILKSKGYWITEESQEIKILW